MIPEDLKYTKEHEWVRLEGETAMVGITDHAQKELGDLVFVELPNVGDKVEAGKPMGTVESVKAVSEIFAPLSGEIAEINNILLEHPETINQDPHQGGWIAKITLSDAAESENLLTAAEYSSFLEEN